ncbi:MAG: hypothetical protein B9S32_15570 [Verrucomicrobia bacterium Tous-C9LFEB]|nr:MAG: hypothetical protein B9S32_15570 [Verrucomicrobia bacterium Tous-C9LFEB]
MWTLNSPIKIGVRLLQLGWVSSFFMTTGYGKITAEFAAGGSSEVPVINEVDAYPGMKGDGWASPWQSRLSAETSLRADPVTGLGSKHGVRISLKAAEGDTLTGALSRAYENVPGLKTGAPHGISFLYRLENPLTEGDSVSVYAAPGPSAVTSAYVSWSLLGDAQRGWCLVDGKKDGTVARLIPTGIPLSAGTVWKISVWADPANATWKVRITADAGEGKSYQSPTLNFRAKPVSMPMPNLTFGANGRLKKGGDIQFSVGDINIDLPQKFE